MPPPATRWHQQVALRPAWTILLVIISSVVVQIVSANAAFAGGNTIAVSGGSIAKD